MHGATCYLVFVMKVAYPAEADLVDLSGRQDHAGFLVLSMVPSEGMLRVGRPKIPQLDAVQRVTPGCRPEIENPRETQWFQLP